MQDTESSTEPPLSRRSTRRSSSGWQAQPSHASSPRIDLPTLQDHFHLPITEVAKKLGVCATVLKKVCRAHHISRWPHRKIKSLDKQLALLEAAKAKGGAPGLKAAEELETVRQQKELLVRNPNGNSSKNSMKNQRRHAAARASYHICDHHSGYGSESSSTTSVHHIRTPRGSIDSSSTISSGSSSPCSATSSPRRFAADITSTSMIVATTRNRSASVSAAPPVRTAPTGRSYSISGTPTGFSDMPAQRAPRASCYARIPIAEPESPSTTPVAPAPKEQPFRHSHPSFTPTPMMNVHRAPSPARPSTQHVSQAPMTVPATLPAFTHSNMHPSYGSHVYGNPTYLYYQMQPSGYGAFDMRYMSMPPQFGAPGTTGAHMPSHFMHQPAPHMPQMPQTSDSSSVHSVKASLPNYGPFAYTNAPFPSFGAPVQHAPPQSAPPVMKREETSNSSSVGNEVMSLMALANTASPDLSVCSEDEGKDSGSEDSDMDVDESSSASEHPNVPTESDNVTLQVSYERCQVGTSKEASSADSQTTLVLV